MKNMKAIFYSVLDTTNKKIVATTGCNNFKVGHNAQAKANAILDEMQKANPSINYKVISTFGKI